MKIKKFKFYLEERDIEEELAECYIKELEKYAEYLKNQKRTIKNIEANKIVEYTEFLVDKNKDEEVSIFLKGLHNYAQFIKNNELIEAMIDIYESYNAMDNLSSRITDWYGKKIRDEIFKGLRIPPLGINPVKKPTFTKTILRRIEEKLGEDKLKELLKPCLHIGYGFNRDVEADRREFLKMGIDSFLKKMKRDQVLAFERNRDEGTPAFAQIVDKEVVDYVKDLETSALGKREGNIIYITKIPYQVKKLLHTNDNQLKRFYACYCPWVRGAIKNGTEKAISKHFCQCSGGYYKDYFEKLLEHPIKIEPIETALTGVPYCKFGVYLPEDPISK
ncbi:MAG: hypothetical protein BAJALOKI2v1_180035 [Promethearchaeota archaeon]|nr:MAG: hypothetical protein BAJALOKI2v1_180035 [Candidatus Lokiarchaeota archaeon]